MNEYRNKYINIINDYYYNNVNLKEWEVFEILCALETNQILIKDLPDDFIHKFNLPHKNDYGVDLISLDYNSCSQVKKYGSKSSITWSHFTNFWTYAKENINSKNLYLLTTKEAKINTMVKQKFINEKKIILIRYDFNKLLLKYIKNNRIIKKPNNLIIKNSNNLIINKNVCKNCNKIFKKRAYLIEHLEKKICNKYLTYENVCKLCNKRYKTKKSLNNHLKKKHNNNITKIENIIPKLYCECGIKFSKKSNLTRHIKLYCNLKKKNMCKNCGIIFSTKSNLNRHINLYCKYNN